MSSSSPDCPISVDPQRCGDECERLRQRDAMHRRIFAAIAAIGREVASTQPLDRILQLVMDKAAETVPMDAGLIFRLDEEAQMYRVAVAYNLPPQELDYIHFAFRHGVPGWVVEHATALIVPDARADTRVHPVVLEQGVLSVMAVPLIAQERVIGVLNFFCKTQTGAFDNEALQLAQLYADQMAVFIENARLVEQLRRATVELEARVEERTRALRVAQVQMVRTEKLAAVGRLAASLAHEINNPLQAVALHLELAAEEASHPAQGELAIVRHELDRIAEIVRRLLDVHHPQPRPEGSRRTRCNVETLLDDVLGLVDTQMRHAGIHVERRVRSPLSPVLADADQLKQLFLNLALNALDAMPGGGRLTIETATSNESIEITFEDTGVGIAPGIIPQIFEPFFSTKPRGTGLGLFVCHEIVSAHGGNVDVTSEPGCGATFVVRLPLAPAVQQFRRAKTLVAPKGESHEHFIEQIRRTHPRR
jgi:two-component system, NtrC family, sensor kinase